MADAEYHRVIITDTATEMLRRIGKKYGKKTYEHLKDLIVELEFDPKSKGEPLRSPLQGLYSRHYSRFRIVFAVYDDRTEVLVAAAGFHQSGSRNDIYKIVQRLIESGQLKLGDGD